MIALMSIIFTRERTPLLSVHECNKRDEMSPCLKVIIITTAHYILYLLLFKERRQN